MIVNVLRFRFKDSADAETRAAVLAAMRRAASMESVSFATVGQDLGDPAEGFTHTYLAAVADLEALERYLYDPVHLAADTEILPHLERLSPVRLSDDPDPGLRQAITRMHLKKVQTYPEWGRMLAAIPDTPIPTRS
ncbi:Dabb family protein [Nocardia mexicana]|uniref:Stress responsive alpha/beta barrel protein n=1 Tax=Nocardia mexicana TaxID=279262 RepID=A0A370GRB7_9NOCA|nr:Dabb family protein [Nocardia mexicana]RDI44493.1 stress responsive alpha/beta barrel protein [Nocardia mexicana]